MISPPLILALDLGTSSFRTMLFRTNGRAVRGSLVSLRVPEIAPGVLDPLQAAETVDQLIDAVCASDQALTISVVATSCFWHSLLGVNRAGEPVTPLYLWSDLRSAPDAQALRNELDDQAVQARTGAALHPTFWPAKLRWIRRTLPDRWREVAAWLSFGDYLHLRWFGRAQSSLSMASATGLFNQSRLVWDDQMIQVAGVHPAALPPIVDLASPSKDLHAPYGERWPQLQTAAWLPPVGDGACSNLGVGAVGRDRWAITVGTSAAVRVVLHDPPETLPRGLWRYRLDASRAVVGGALNNGGNVYEWLRRTLRLPSSAELERELLQRSRGAHGLTVDPTLFGERSPGWSLDATGSIAGLTGQTSAVDLVQALLESVTDRIAEIARLMETALGPPQAIVATGGGMVSSTAWRRMLELALGRAVTPSPVQESSLRGAAMLAVELLERESPESVPEGAGKRDHTRDDEHASGSELNRSFG